MQSTYRPGAEPEQDATHGGDGLSKHIGNFGTRSLLLMHAFDSHGLHCLDTVSRHILKGGRADGEQSIRETTANQRILQILQEKQPA